MKYFVAVICILMSIQSANAQNTVKYQGAKIPLGTYWKVVKEGDYFQSKIKTDETYFYVKYLGQNLSNDQKSKMTMAFLNQINVEIPKIEPFDVEVGKNGVAKRFDWKGTNKNNMPTTYYVYLYETLGKSSKSKNYVLVYEEECEEKNYCDKYSMHRENFEKVFYAK